MTSEHRRCPPVDLSATFRRADPSFLPRLGTASIPSSLLPATTMSYPPTNSIQQALDRRDTMMTVNLAESQDHQHPSTSLSTLQGQSVNEDQIPGDEKEAMRLKGGCIDFTPCGYVPFLVLQKCYSANDTVSSSIDATVNVAVSRAQSCSGAKNRP